MVQQDTSKASGAVGIIHRILSVVCAEIMSGALAHRAPGLGKERVVLDRSLITNCNKLSNLSYNTMHAIDEVDCATKEQR